MTIARSRGDTFIRFLLSFLCLSIPNLSFGDALWMSITPGARRSAMADADTALPANEDGIFHNPAALANIVSRSVRAQTVLGFEDLRGTGIGLLWPSLRSGTWGLHVNSATAGSMEVTPLAGPTVETQNAQTETVVSASWGGNMHQVSPLLPPIAFGAVARYFLEEVAESGTDTGHSLDVGAQVPIFTKRATVGVAFQNLGGRIGSEDLPRIWSAGASYSLGKPSSHQGIIDFDLARLANGETSPRLGGEYDYHGLLALRAGIALRNAGNEDRWAGGVGVRLPFESTRVDLDYAYRSAGPLGGIHAMDLTWRWKPAVKNKVSPPKKKLPPRRMTLEKKR